MVRPSRAVDEVLHELGGFFVDELAATQVALACLRTVAHQVRTSMDGSADPDQALLVGAEVPDIFWVAPVQGSAGARALAKHVAEGGLIAQRLTQQLIVTLFTAWEEEFRGRLARAHGCDKDDMQAPFFGDLRWLRIDIVHNRGRATAKYSARCETVLNRRLAPGDPVYLTDEELRQMHLRMPWGELVTSPKRDWAASQPVLSVNCQAPEG